MSHYPSTQELADMRRSIPCTHDHTTGWEGCPFSTLDRAHDSELRDGIGYRASSSRVWHTGTWHTGTQSRRMASSLRSRAYARIDPGCDCCGLESHGIVSTDTWTEDEPRHPLPIRYQPAWVLIP